MKTNPLYHMKNALIFASWKSNKTKNEAESWLGSISSETFPSNLEVVILPPFTLLDFISNFIKERSLPFKIGAQDVSPFESGPYTGEISASQIKEFGEYALIGHSERRTNFGESDEMVLNKVKQVASFGLIPVVCVSDLSQLTGLQSYKDIIIAYEPPGAISTSGPNANSENPEQVSEFAQKVKERLQTEIIYGGSVNAGNVRDYLSLENISGVLVGGESLDVKSFINILKNVV